MENLLSRRSIFVITIIEHHSHIAQIEITMLSTSQYIPSLNSMSSSSSTLRASLTADKKPLKFLKSGPIEANYTASINSIPITRTSATEISHGSVNGFKFIRHHRFHIYNTITVVIIPIAVQAPNARILPFMNVSYAPSGKGQSYDSVIVPVGTWLVPSAHKNSLSKRKSV